MTCLSYTFIMNLANSLSLLPHPKSFISRAGKTPLKTDSNPLATLNRATVLSVYP